MVMHLVPFSLIITLVALVIPSQLHSSPLDYRIFTNGQSQWIANGKSLVLYKGDTRTARPVVLSDSLENDSIVDIASFEGALWISALSGVYQIDMSTGTIERESGPNGTLRTGKITSDIDYTWLFSNDTLWKYDKLSREWSGYHALTKGNTIAGIYSDGDNVHSIGGKSVDVFSISDEKWTDYPVKNMSIKKGTFLINKNALIIVDSLLIARYVVASRNWDIIKALSPVTDIFLQDTALYYLTKTGVFQYSTITAVSRPLSIPGIEGATTFTKANDTLLIPTSRSVVKYSISSQNSEYLSYNSRINSTKIAKTTILGKTFLLFSPLTLEAYDPSTNLWEQSSLVAAATKRKIFTWDDQDNFSVHYTPSVSTQIRGDIQEQMKLTGKDSLSIRIFDTTIIDTTQGGLVDTIYKQDTSKVLYYGYLIPDANVTVHNTFTNERYLDFFFNNKNVSQRPTEGFLYRGNRKDNLTEARLGKIDVEIPQSRTVPPVNYEGLSATIESKSMVENSDRKVVRAQVGAGLQTTKTIYSVLSYRDDGLYQIPELTSNDSTEQISIVPGSMKISVDGEEIDSSMYSFVSLTGDIQFNRTDILDPTSVIVVSYQIEKISSDALKRAQLFPLKNFGDMEYGSVTISPMKWLSARAGYVTGKQNDNRYQLGQIAAPIELRSNSPDYMVKVDPEISNCITPDGVSRAGSVSLQSRMLHSTSLTFNGLIADTGFISTDQLTNGYGPTKAKSDFKISHSILKEMPLTYSQFDGYYARGNEHRYELSSGVHFAGLPFFDVSLSRNKLSATLFDTTQTLVNPGTDSLIASIDTLNLDRLKDKLHLRFYELSSPVIEKILHINRLNYELSYLSFSSVKEHERDTTILDTSIHQPTEDKGTGSVLYGRASISPFQSLTFSGLGTFRRNPEGSRYVNQSNPIITLQTIDLPLGMDLSGRYSINYGAMASKDSTDSSTLAINRSASLQLRPGAWFEPLSWFSLFGGVVQNINCIATKENLSTGHIVWGDTAVSTSSLIPNVGITIFPNNDILIRNNNQWTIGDSLKGWYTFNDVKLFFGSNRLWQTRYEYNDDKFGETFTKKYHRGYTRFDNTWASWMKTTTGIFAGYTSLDSLLPVNLIDTITGIITIDTLSKIKETTQLGPEIGVTFSLMNVAFVKKLLNSHSLKMYWKKSDSRYFGATPDISYAVSLRAVFLPNVSLSSTNSITVSKGKLNMYNGVFSLGLIF